MNKINKLKKRVRNWLLFTNRITWHHKINWSVNSTDNQVIGYYKINNYNFRVIGSIVSDDLSIVVLPYNRY